LGGKNMLYRQKFDTFIRIYDDIGYISNRSNFIDRVTDKSGSAFLNALSRHPKSLEEIMFDIIAFFENPNQDIIKQDIIEFYKLLEEDGFIVSGETPEELNKKDVRFSYNEIAPKTSRKGFTPKIFRSEGNTQEYLENYFKHNPRLTQFQIELTSRCNERCIHCYIPHENKIDDITPELFYNTLDQCRDMGVLSLTFSGGEPLLHPNIIDFLRRAKDCDFSINILSNLTVLTKEIINEMKENRLSSVQVSLYSLTPDIHDSITKMKGSFLKTYNAIIELIENDIPLQISCPVMKQNRKSYTDVVKWAEAHKVRAITDYIMMARYDHTTSNLDNRLSLDEVGDIINDIIDNDTDYQKRLINTNFEEIESHDISEETLCGVCISSICMVANGNIYPCAGWQDYVVGNIKQESLKDIWNKSPKVQYLRGLRKKHFPGCIECKDRSFCAMCMVRNANEDPDGSPLKINEHFCKVAELNHNIVLDWKRKLQFNG
jgi:radical SAM protein with 4Fe4S-binding SPASM domain